MSIHVSTLQSQLAHNRAVITELLALRRVLKAQERAFYRSSTEATKTGVVCFKMLNHTRDELRNNSLRLRNLGELQIILKQAIRNSN